jgi:hypothetical protein
MGGPVLPPPTGQAIAFDLLVRGWIAEHKTVARIGELEGNGRSDG